MKILHFADVHARTEDLEEIERCTQHLLEVAGDEKPDLIIDAGDIFDNQHVRADSPAVKYIHRWMRELADIAPVARVMGTRSHDGKASEILDLIGARFPIHTAANGPLQLLLTPNGNLFTAEGHQAASSGLLAPGPVCAVVSLVPAPTKEHLVGLVEGDIKETDQLIARGLAALFAGLGAMAAEYQAPHILVGHWNTTGAYISPTQVLTGVDIEVSREQMMLARPTLVCLGHIHKAQRIGSDPIFYSGSTQINTWGELDPKGFYIHEIEDGLDSRFIETPTRRRFLVSHDFTRDPADPVSAITRAAADACAPFTIGATSEGAMVRVAIKYFQDKEALFDDEEIARIFPGSHSVEILRTRVARANVRAARMMELERLRDKIEQRADLLEEEVSPGVLAKADALEDTDPETLLAKIEADADEPLTGSDERRAA